MHTASATARPGGTSRWARCVIILGVVVGVIALLMMLLSGPAYRLHLLGLGAAFTMMGFGAKIGIAAVLVSVPGLILSLIARRGRRSLYAIVGIVLGVAAFVPPWMFAQKAGSVPPIHDISTDTTNPPAFRAVLPLRAHAANGSAYGGTKVAAQQHQAYPDIKPLTFKAAPNAVFDAALSTARNMGWKIDTQNVNQGRIEATDTTFWFGFKDDVAIRIRADTHGSQLDIRSESRIGKSDVGANAARIRAFRSRLRQRLGNAG